MVSLGVHPEDEGNKDRELRKSEGALWPQLQPRLTGSIHTTDDGKAQGGKERQKRGASGTRTCDVDIREVSCRPVRSEEEMFTGAPRCNRMLTFLSRSIPEKVC